MRGGDDGHRDADRQHQRRRKQPYLAELARPGLVPAGDPGEDDPQRQQRQGPGSVTASNAPRLLRALEVAQRAPNR